MQDGGGVMENKEVWNIKQKEVYEDKIECMIHILI